MPMVIIIFIIVAGARREVSAWNGTARGVHESQARLNNNNCSRKVGTGEDGQGRKRVRLYHRSRRRRRRAPDLDGTRSGSLPPSTERSRRQTTVRERHPRVRVALSSSPVQIPTFPFRSTDGPIIGRRRSPRFSRRLISRPATSNRLNTSLAKWNGSRVHRVAFVHCRTRRTGIYAARPTPNPRLSIAH